MNSSQTSQKGDSKSHAELKALALITSQIILGIIIWLVGVNTTIDMFPRVLLTICMPPMLVTGFIGFYLLYSQYGAVYYVVYAVLSIITTSVGVGILIFREPFNPYQVGALILAILAIVLFSYGQALAK